MLTLTHTRLRLFRKMATVGQASYGIVFTLLLILGEGSSSDVYGDEFSGDVDGIEVSVAGLDELFEYLAMNGMIPSNYTHLFNESRRLALSDHQDEVVRLSHMGIRRHNIESYLDGYGEDLSFVRRLDLSTNV